MINKIFITLAILICTTNTSFAASCPEDSEIAKAKEKYLDKIIEIYDSAVGDPSDSRSVASCLSSLEGLGDIFSMGISLPEIDNILDKLCDVADSYVQDAVNEAKDIVNEAKEIVTEDPTFKVVMNPNAVVDDLLSNLK